MLVAGATYEEVIKETGIPAETVQALDRWLNGKLGQNWLRDHPELVPKPKVIDEKKIPGIVRTPPQRTPTLGPRSTVTELAAGRSQLLVSSLASPEVVGEIEVEQAALTAKNISVTMTPLTIMWLNYAKSIGYDQAPHQFIEDVVVGWFRDRGITIGIIKKEDNLKALMAAKNVKIFVVREEGGES